MEIPTLSYTLSPKNVLFRVEPLRICHYRAYISWVSLTANKFTTIHELKAIFRISG